MNSPHPLPSEHRNKRISTTAAFIARTQLPSGAIPWFETGIVDPWDHVESIMGLTIGGYHDAAQSGFEWLAQCQRDDGAWFAAYNNLSVADASRAESNFVAYPATGLWHYYLATTDIKVLQKFWPMVEAAMNWVLNLQSPHGEVYWAVDVKKGVSHDALITGCCSIYKSLECIANIAKTLNLDTKKWLVARDRLGHALRNHPERFDRTWASKSRYSMDWFYPILTGVITGEAAKQRLTERWHEFVEEGLGCRCVVEEPWVTIAESCELTMACLAADARPRAEGIFTDLQGFQVSDGSWWTGYVFPDDAYWPDEKPTWTAAAVLLAADALFDLTAASKLFVEHRD